MLSFLLIFFRLGFVELQDDVDDFLLDCSVSAYVGCAGSFHVQGFSLHLQEHCPSRCHCHRHSTTSSMV